MGCPRLRTLAASSEVDVLARGKTSLFQRAVDVVEARGGHLDDVHDEGHGAQALHGETPQLAGVSVVFAERLHNLGGARDLQARQRRERNVVVMDRQAHVLVGLQGAELLAALADDPERPFGVEIFDRRVAHDTVPGGRQRADLVPGQEGLDLRDQVSRGHARLCALLRDPVVCRSLPVDATHCESPSLSIGHTSLRPSTQDMAATRFSRRSRAWDYERGRGELA